MVLVAKAGKSIGHLRARAIDGRSIEKGWVRGRERNMRMMREKKKPRITIVWIVIAVISVNQAVWAYQDFQIHQQLRNQIQLLQKQHLNLLRQLNMNLETVLTETLNNR